MTIPTLSRSKTATLVAWLAQLTVAVIFSITFWFKFSYAPETRYIFGDLGGRPAATVAGTMELLCAILILIPRTAAVGAALALGTMGGAIMTHLFTKVGVQIPNVSVVGGVLIRTGGNDGGTLFLMALGAALAAAIVLIIRRRELPVIGKRLP